jgi:hypothetical protein
MKTIQSLLALALLLLPLESAAQPSTLKGCAPAPTSPLTINVKDTGAKGDGQTDDTAALQRAIDAVGGKGGTVFVPDGSYMVNAVGAKQLSLKSAMTLKLSAGATLKAIPNAEQNYSILTISAVSDVAVVGGTLLGDRDEHQGSTGEWGMGIMIMEGAERITIDRVTSRKMWGDGFYVGSGKHVTLCSVVADHNRRQGLSIIHAHDVTVTDSVFSNTRGTDPSAGIDLEPDQADQTITKVLIRRSKFLRNAGPGILIAAQKRAQNISDVVISNNYFQGTPPIKIKYAPGVLDSAICHNRYVVPRDTSRDLSAVGGSSGEITVTAGCGDVGIRKRQK